MLKALEQHLTDFNFKEVRDGVVKLRQLGRIMTGPSPSVARVCPSCLRSSTTCVSRASKWQVTTVSKLGKMYARLEVSPDVSDEDLRHACRWQSAEYDWNVARIWTTRSSGTY